MATSRAGTIYCPSCDNRVELDAGKGRETVFEFTEETIAAVEQGQICCTRCGDRMEIRFRDEPPPGFVQ
jgi:uncharacterized Zn finger protein (UPF0148 family)